MSFSSVFDAVINNCKLIDGNIYKYNKSKRKLCIVKNRKNHTNGYCKMCIQGRMVYYHRALWILSKNEDIPEGMQIDHLDGDKLNNTINNLRVVTNRQNGQNWNIHRNGSLVGAKYSKADKKWKSQIRLTKGSQIHLGTFDSQEEAHRAYIEALKNIV